MYLLSSTRIHLTYVKGYNKIGLVYFSMNNNTWRKTHADRSTYGNQK